MNNSCLMMNNSALVMNNSCLQCTPALISHIQIGVGEGGGYRMNGGRGLVGVEGLGGWRVGGGGLDIIIIKQ